MPIPQHTLERLLDAKFEIPGNGESVRLDGKEGWRLPTSLAPQCWGIAPGLLQDGGGKDSTLPDLDHRLHQAGIHSEVFYVLLEGQKTEGRLLLGTGRRRAIALAYKLKEWAVFRFDKHGLNVVYSGHNSRSR